jgi:hypothetical protein
MGIETYGSMVFPSMKQILNDVHDADVSVVTLFRKQRSHPFGPFIPGERNFFWKPLPELRPDLTATW